MTETRVIREEVVLVVRDLGRRITDRRFALGLTHRDIGRRMGVSKMRVIQLVGQGERISEDAFNRLSEALEMSWEDWTKPLPTVKITRDAGTRLRSRAKAIAAKIAADKVR